jgi:hypothetical protein
VIKMVITALERLPQNLAKAFVLIFYSSNFNDKL